MRSSYLPRRVDVLHRVVDLLLNLSSSVCDNVRLAGYGHLVTKIPYFKTMSHASCSSLTIKITNSVCHSSLYAHPPDPLATRR